MKYLFLFFTSFTFYGQVLHHQMISSQGGTMKLSNGLIVRQTIGQQNIIGSSIGNNIILQGFQQNLWSQYISTNNVDSIITKTYPNPFVNTINFQFSESIDEVIEVFIFDVVGHLVFNKSQKPIDNILSLDLDIMAGNEYLVRLKATNYIYYTKILKQ